jgi:hypothetical protein
MRTGAELSWTADREEQRQIEREAIGFAVRSPATAALGVFVLLMGIFDAFVANVFIGLLMVAMFLALWFGLTWTRVRRQVLRGFPAGERIVIRYDAETFTVQAHGNEATLPYSELGSPRVGDHLVSWSGRHTRIVSLPRALVPDEALVWIAERHGPETAPPAESSDPA